MNLLSYPAILTFLARQVAGYSIPAGRSPFWIAPATAWQSNRARFSRAWLKNGWLASRRRAHPDPDPAARVRIEPSRGFPESDGWVTIKR